VQCVESEKTRLKGSNEGIKMPMKFVAYQTILDTGSQAWDVSSAKLPPLKRSMLFVGIVTILFSSFYYSINSSHRRADSFYGPLTVKNSELKPFYLAPVAVTNEANTAKPAYESFNFKKTKPFYRALNLHYVSYVNKTILIERLLETMPSRIRVKAENYIEEIILFSEMNNIDPLWAISIAWTESHFRPKAKSKVSALGLMQIMPATGGFINELLNRPTDRRLVLELLKDPRTNIELGTFYLKRLLKRFRNSHKHATVAYNMGPNFVSYRLRNSLPVGVKNQYLDKVNRHYMMLLSGVKKLQKESRLEAAQSVLTYRPVIKNSNYFLGLDIFTMISERYALN